MHSVASRGMGAMHGALASEINPDSSADVCGMPDAHEDYGNEPVFEEECEPADEAWAEGPEPHIHDVIDLTYQHPPQQQPASPEIAGAAPGSSNSN